MDDEIRGKIERFLLSEKIREIKKRGEYFRLRFAYFDIMEKQRELEERYNHNHDSKGRFTFSSGGGNVDKKRTDAYNDSGGNFIKITDKAIKSVGKPDIFADDKCNERVREMCREVLREAQKYPLNTETSDSVALKDIVSGNIRNNRIRGKDGEGMVDIAVLNEAYLSIHNHPSGDMFSERDIRRFNIHSTEKIMIAIGNNGKMYTLQKTPSANWIKFQVDIADMSEKEIQNLVKERAADYGFEYNTF